MGPTENLLLMVAIWSAIAAGVAHFLPTWTMRAAFTLAAVGIPFWEIPFGYYNFRKLCDQEGPLKVYEPVEPQTTVCAEGQMAWNAEYLLKGGFSSVEARPSKGGIVRLTRRPSGTIDRVPIERVTSKYCLENALNQRQPWRILRHDYLVRNEKEARLVARASAFTWSGTWWQEAASPLLGYGGACVGRPFESISKFLRGEIKQLGSTK